MRRYFITGLLIWVPLGITVWVLNLLIGTLDQSLLLVPESLRPQAMLGLNIPGIGAILTLLVIPALYSLWMEARLGAEAGD